MKILVTGANGFVGSAFCHRLLEADMEINATTRSASSVLPSSDLLTNHAVGDMDSQTNWKTVLTGVGVVVHLAARVHMMNDRATDPIREFLRVNHEATANLARQAASVGVSRFVYLSSIKVNGESTEIEKPFTERDIPNPQDPYAISKLRAEQALKDISIETGMEVVIVRPPLIYGPGVKANFLKLLEIVGWGIPLPLGCVNNKRSYIYVGNLCDALLQCAVNPAAAGHTFLVDDGNAVSTAQLVNSIAQVLGSTSRLIPVPIHLMRGMARLAGKTTAMDRLTKSLVIDSSRINAELGWAPPFSFAQGLQDTADWFRRSDSSKLPA